jgi:adenosylmethionine-8-amino-7-oxononanoate aminotransferase
MIVEPLCQGTAGMALYSEQYLREACERCRAAGILFIVDEIAMGYGRTGKMFAFEHAGIDPDIVTVGKGITAGYLPLSAAIVRDSIYDTFSDQETDHTFYHGHTFAGNPIACAAALKTLDLYREEKIVEQAARKGKFLQEQLGRFSDFSTIRDIRGLGMVAAIDCADVSLARRIQQRMKAAGYLLRPLGDTIYLMLPLVTPEETIIEVIDALVVCFESESA